jgi:hypothetical protein
MKLFNTLVIGFTYAASTSDADFNWYLEPTGIPTANIGATTTPKIQLTYEISNHAPAVRVFAIDCTTTATAVVALLQTPLAIRGSTHLAFAVILDVDPSEFANSNILTNVDSTTAKIELCVRVDLLDSTGTSYNFNERKIFVTIDLTQGFAVAAVDTTRAAAGEDNARAQTDYGLTVCQCNQTSICSTEPLAQGDAAFLCIKATDGSGVTVSSVQQLTFNQTGVIEIPAVDNGVGNGLTDVVIEGTMARIQSQLPSILFDPANVGIPLVGSGTVVVRVGSGRARNLRFDIGNSVGHIGGSASRMMQEQTSEAKTGFSVSMALAPLKSEDTPKANVNIVALIGGIVGGIAGVAIIVALVLAARRKNEDEKDEETKASSIDYA